MSSNVAVETIAIILTILATISTCVIHHQTPNPPLTANVACWVALGATVSIVFIDTLVHFLYPRPSELRFEGPEIFFIVLFAIYEIVPTAVEFETFRNNHPRLQTASRAIEWVFGVLGALVAFLSLGTGLSMLGDLEYMASVINAYGILFVIGAVGLGELTIRCIDTFESECCQCCCGCFFVIELIIMGLFMWLFFVYLPTSTALVYFFSTIAFLVDVGFGIRTRFLGPRLNPLP